MNALSLQPLCCDGLDEEEKADNILQDSTSIEDYEICCLDNLRIKNVYDDHFVILDGFTGQKKKNIF